MAKLAFVLPSLAGGGAERVALTLIENFLASGHSVDLVLVQAEGALLDHVPRGVELVDLGARRLRGAIRPLAAYLRDRRPDAVQISLWPLTVAGVIAHRLARSSARLVLSDHTAFPKAYLTRAQMRALSISARLFYPLADARVIVSNDAADALARISGLPREAFTVIYNPVIAPEPITSTPEVDRLWRGAGARILTVGALKPEKNHALLLRAFALLLNSRSDARLMILGDGTLREELTALAERLGIADKVCLPGFSADPWPYYASADLFALSSNAEGYPLVIVEAMLAGLPIVSTDCVSGPREILDDGRYGILVPLDDPDALARGLEQAIGDRNPAEVRERALKLSAIAGEHYERLLLG